MRWLILQEDGATGNVEVVARRRYHGGIDRRKSRMTLDQPSDEDRAQAKPESIARMRRYAEKFAEKSGSYLHPHPEITEFLVIGLAKHVDDLGRPLCPCNFYEDKVAEAKKNTWI